MSFFPPSGYHDNQLDGTDPQWTRWFAWFPVTVDAYDVSEIRGGKMRYRVWLRWVECRMQPDRADEDFTPSMQFRLPRRI